MWRRQRDPRRRQSGCSRSCSGSELVGSRQFCKYDDDDEDDGDVIGQVWNLSDHVNSAEERNFYA